MQAVTDSNALDLARLRALYLFDSFILQDKTVS
jgi:hypothetical protein